ncbi:MAG: YdcF family protein [Fibrobacter sp.]|nr:YdcF family protein [Fibrobacter sp.]
MKFPSLFKKKECIVPTSVGWLFVAVCVSIPAVLIFYNIHDFLSENRPVQAEFLVVEGWIPDYGLIQVKQVFEKNKYRGIITTGGPLEVGSYLKEYHSYAEVAASTLNKLGIPDSLIVALPAGFVRKDRTWQSALAFRQWFESTKKENDKFDLVSLGAHSRRSAFVFKKVLRTHSIKIGVISLENMEYHPQKWWCSSAGVKTVITELVSYLYTRVFFVFTGS